MSLGCLGQTPAQEKVGSQINLADFANGVHSQRFPNLPAGLLVRGDPGVPAGLVNSNWKLLDPRWAWPWMSLVTGAPAFAPVRHLSRSALRQNV